jgi:DNA invertase Pin-like site-specific DNA recombinase
MEDDQGQYNRVVAYIRKSSEDGEDGKANKQLNSLSYQREFVIEATKRYDLELVHKAFEDDKTGYEAFVRDGFNQMMEYLKENQGKVDGIVCTEISRLARNFADGGMILWYLQSGVIKRIYTPSKVFTNSSSDKLMVAIEFAMSKKSSDETGYRTKQGMKTKSLTMKHPPRPAILGYKTEGQVGRKKWVIDKKIGPKIVQVFQQFATGKYTFDQIADYAFNIGISSNKSKIGKYGKTTWRNRLTDKQYTGIFEYDGEEIAGEYEPLIDSRIFYIVQRIISGNQHPKTTHLDYAYTSLVKCSDCGGFLSGTHKKGITYYRCSKRNLPCKKIERKPYVTEDRLEENLMSELKKIEIDNETWEAAKDYVSKMNQPQKADLKRQIRMLIAQVEAEGTMQINLGRKFAEGDLSKPEYNKLLDDSKQKQISLRESIVKCENMVVELDKLMSQFLDNVKYVTKKLHKALPENKKEFVDIFCENLTWDGKKLRWNWKKPYFFLTKVEKKSDVLPVHELIRNISQFIDAPDVIGAKIASLSTI